jgi:hypothetical protein
MNTDGDKLYMKIVSFDENYNFVVQTLFIGSQLQTQIINILFKSQFWYPDQDSHRLLEFEMISNEKNELQNCRSRRKL